MDQLSHDQTPAGQHSSRAGKTQGEPTKPPAPPNPSSTTCSRDERPAGAQQQLQQWSQQVAQLSAAVTQTEKAGSIRPTQSIDQIDESIKQVDKQQDAADQQAQQTAEQRAKQKKLQDEQDALSDVRAKPVKVKNVAKVQEVLAPTTVTQIEGTPSVTITATPDTSDLGALTTTIQSRLDAIDRPAAGRHGDAGRCRAEISVTRSTSSAWPCWWPSHWSS